ncbi:MAG: hypothetical protein FJY85_22350, partial [Deltaproteobacteria bacterium]|nr:hypothetical protein [Deltaproteobacteria bacterium]
MHRSFLKCRHAVILLLLTFFFLARDTSPILSAERRVLDPDGAVRPRNALFAVNAVQHGDKKRLFDVDNHAQADTSDVPSALDEPSQRNSLTTAYVDSRNFRSFKDAVESIGDTEQRTLLVPNEQNVDTFLTVPDNVTLLFFRGGCLHVQPKKRLNINGEIQAGLYQIFKGEGTVSGRVKNPLIYPEWWGTTGDGKTNDYPAVSKALAFTVDAQKTLYLNEMYAINQGLEVRNRSRFCIMGRQQHDTGFKALGEIDILTILKDKQTKYQSDHIRIEQLTLQGGKYESKDGSIERRARSGLKLVNCQRSVF